MPMHPLNHNNSLAPLLQSLLVTVNENRYWESLLGTVIRSGYSKVLLKVTPLTNFRVTTRYNGSQ